MFEICSIPASEPVTFTIGGDTFQCVPVVPAAALLDLEKASKRPRAEQAAAIMDFLDLVLTDESAALLAQRMRDNYPKITMGRMGKTLEKIPTKDLYYLKRGCDDAKDFSKKFWWEINPKKHENEG